MAGKIPLAKGVTYDNLGELIVNDYRNNSLGKLRKTNSYFIHRQPAQVLGYR
jgi:hypothetical protein